MKIPQDIDTDEIKKCTKTLILMVFVVLSILFVIITNTIK
jgi:hypothetical protein